MGRWIVVCLVLCFAGTTHAGVLSTSLNWLLDEVDRQIPGTLEHDGLIISAEQGLRLSSLHYNDPRSGLVIDLRDLTFRLDLAGLWSRHIAIMPLHIGVLAITPPHPHDKPPPAPYQGFDLPDLTLPFSLTLDPVRIDQLIWSEQTLNDILLRVEYTAEHGLRLNTFQAEHALATAKMAVTLQPRGDWPLTLQLHAQVPAEALMPLPDGATLQLQASGGLKTTLNSALTLNAGSPRLDLEIELSAIQQPSPQAVIRGHWQALRWPLAGSPEVRSDQGHLHIQGELNDWRAEIEGMLASRQLTHSDWSLIAAGNLQRAREFVLTSTLLDGTLRLEGQADWLPYPQWQLALQTDRLALDQIATQAPAPLTLALTTQGSLREAQLDMIVELQRLDGQVQQQPLQGQGQLQLSGPLPIPALSARDFQLRVGEATLQLDGRAEAQQLDFRWALNVPQLQVFLPQAQGRIAGEGRLSGAIANPQAQLDVAIDALRYTEQVALEQLRLTGQLDLTPEAPNQLELNGQGLQLGTRRWQRLTLQGQGTRAAHQLTLDLAGEAVETLSLQLDGLLGEEGAWQGTLRQLQVGQTPLGAWRLQAPVALSVTPPQQGQLEGPLCLVQGTRWVCLDALQRDAEGALAARLRLENLDSGLFDPFLPPNLALETALAGQAQVRFAPTTQALQLEGGFALQPGRLRTQVNGMPLVITVREGTLQLDGTAERLDGQLRVDLAENGRIEADLGLLQLLQSPQLDSRLRMSFDNFALLQPFIEVVRELQGRFEVDVGIEGPLTAPRIVGGAELSDGSADIPLANLALRNLQLALQGRDDGLDIQGEVTSGTGQLLVQGRLDLPPEPALRLELAGDEWVVFDTQDIQARISPELQIDASAAGELSLQGTVVVPFARLSSPELDMRGRGQRPSSDVIVAQNTEQAKTEIATPPSRTNIDLNIELGDVRARVAEFDGALSGALRLIQAPPLPIQANGSLQVGSGDYTLYGQAIRIDSGRVIFAGPILNPGLDLRISRNNDEMSAGAQVSGTLRQPRFSFFSEPPMSNANALSFLALGRTPHDGGQNTALLRAATSMAGSGALDTLRLDGLSIEAEGSGDDSGITIGRYLNPDLYVGYGIGLFNSLETFYLRYTVLRGMTLGASTNSEASTVSIGYSFER